MLPLVALSRPLAASRASNDGVTWTTRPPIPGDLIVHPPQAEYVGSDGVEWSVQFAPARLESSIPSTDAENNSK